MLGNYERNDADEIMEWWIKPGKKWQAFITRISILIHKTPAKMLFLWPNWWPYQKRIELKMQNYTKWPWF